MYRCILLCWNVGSKFTILHCKSMNSGFRLVHTVWLLILSMFIGWADDDISHQTIFRDWMTRMSLADRHFLQFWGLHTHFLHLTFFMSSCAIVLLKIYFYENADWARDFPFHQWLWMDIIYIWCECATFYLLSLPQISTNGVKNFKSIIL